MKVAAKVIRATAVARSQPAKLTPMKQTAGRNEANLIRKLKNAMFESSQINYPFQLIGYENLYC